MQTIAKKRDGFFPFPDLGLSWNLQEGFYPPGGLFASVGQMGVGFGVSPNPHPDPKDNGITDLYAKYVSPEFGFRVIASPADTALEAAEQLLEEAKPQKKKKKKKLKIRIGNPHFRRLFSGAIAGAVSRTAVAPLETIRTHLMVGSNGNSTTQVFHTIIRTEGWKGLFRGNFVNVIRVAPSKAIELFAYDTAKKILTPKMGESPKLPVPSSLVAGAFAGVSSTLCTYPLELLKTRLTIQVCSSPNERCVEGPAELYRGLTPSLIGVVPYAATNYFAYETLKKLYRKTFKEEEIGNIATLLIGSAAGAISSSATFPLEVARKHMQVGAVGGRQVYKNMLHALISILEKEGLGGLYKGLGPSCMKLVPAAGISFMCYEACKKILIDGEDDA
ncbi:adenine nucleotide transporter BT1, chloroplastic/mitochondrial isoform X3 [Elaeis guineensis]|uniref:Adenine nucleotide transporter BT1, chloroplastic/mitochondrial isoform X3 n=1 Tax=Elaeis guineensis var. tenera TaxID=51953 RepID=A0A6J0PL78_ELAGV|nr:adenine nucleotide transporter BT1, chloroplastic/mitochondrial isoform X3 [Elaeis guineensis]